MEKLSIDSLFNLNSPSVILNALKQAGVEGSEEFLTTLANGAMDILVMGDKSQLNLTKQRYEALDFEPGEAERLALRDFGQQALTDALSGMISGGVTAYGKAGIDTSYELSDLIENWNVWDNFNGGGWNGISGLQWSSPYGHLRPALASVGADGFTAYNGWTSDAKRNAMHMAAKSASGESANSLEKQINADYTDNVIQHAEKKYWKPRLSKVEWDILNNSMRRDIGEPAPSIADDMHCFCKNEKGETVFAVYGGGDKTDPTVFYASGGKKAQAEYLEYCKMMEGDLDGIYRSRTGFARFIKAVKRQKGDARRNTALAENGRSEN